MNELFINWRTIKEENSWSYAWRFYHNRHRMIKESSIIFQDMIRDNRNQSKEFLLWERFLMFLQRTFWSYKVKRTSSLYVFFNTYLHLLSCYLLMYFVRMFQWECSREHYDLVKITKHLHQSKWQIWSFDKCQECAESKIKKNCYSFYLTKRRINDHKN